MERLYLGDDLYLNRNDAGRYSFEQAGNTVYAAKAAIVQAAVLVAVNSDDPISPRELQRDGWSRCGDMWTHRNHEFHLCLVDSKYRLVQGIDITLPVSTMTRLRLLVAGLT